MVERRHGGRAETHGSVFLRSAAGARGRILDVSSRGVRFQLAPGDRAAAVDARVAIDLRLDGSRRRWFHLGGRVRRVDDDGRMVVCLYAVPMDFEDAVQDELLAMLENQAFEHVLLVDNDDTRREIAAAKLRANGQRVTAVATPLEVISHLGESRDYPQLVIIAHGYPETIADELRDYVTIEHADIRVERA